LPPVSELGEPFDRGLVGLQIKPLDENLGRVGRCVLRLAAGRMNQNRGNDGQATGPHSIHRWSSHQMRTLFSGARKSLSAGFTLKASYQASMFRTTPLTRY
jgi:hypothetical protein